MPERKRGDPSEKGKVIKGPVKIGNVFVTGEIGVSGKIIKGDQVTRNGQEVAGEEAEQIKARAQSAAEQARTAAAQQAERAAREAALNKEGQSTNGKTNAPNEFFSDDFVAGTVYRNGVAYKLDLSTIDRESNYRYVRVDK